MANSTKISEYSTTAANNTSIDSIDIDENCAASGINNALRSVLKHQADAFTQGTPIALDQTNNRVGIGTTSPSQNLHVSGATNPAIRVTDTTNTVNAEIMATNSEVFIGSESNHPLYFVTNNSNRVAITSDGKVGIGTNSPSTTMHVQRASSGGTATSTAALIVEGTDATGADIQILGDDTDYQRFLFGDASDNDVGAIEYSHSGNSMRFTTNASERMRIDSSGKVYIGRTGDPYMSTGSVKRLSIDGGTTSTDSTIVSNKNSASTMYHFYFHNSNSVVGSISTNAHATSFNTSSDHRLKENVADITGAIARVKSLQPKRFNWITEPNTTIDGFLAHEAATVVPESVTGSHNETRAATGIVKAAGGKVLAESVEQADWTANKGDDEGDLYPSDSTWTASEDLPVYQTIDQAKLVPLLTAALKESIAKIETLETEMTALKARVTALEA